MKSLKRSKSALITVVDQAVVSGAGFITNVLAARILGVEDFGVFALLWLVLLFFQSIQTALVTTPLMVIGSSSPDRLPNNYFRSMISIQLILSILFSLMAIVALAVILDGRRNSEFAISLSILILFSQFQDYSRRYYFTIGDFVTPLIQDVVRYLVQIICILAMYALSPRGGNDVSSILLVCAFASLCAVVPFAWRMPKPSISFEHISAAVVRNFNFAKWQLGSALLQWLTANFIVIASASALGVAAAGALRAGQSVLGLTNVFFQAAENVIPQISARIWRERGVRELKNFTLKLTIVATSVTAFACLTLAYFGELIITSIFGPDYAGFGYVISGYAMTFFIMSAVVPSRFAAMAMEDTRTIFFAYAAGAAVALIGGHPLIDRFGLLGALGAIALSQAALGIVLLIGNARVFLRA